VTLAKSGTRLAAALRRQGSTKEPRGGIQ